MNRGRYGALTWTRVTFAPSRASNSASCRVWLTMPPRGRQRTNETDLETGQDHCVAAAERSKDRAIARYTRRPVALLFDKAAALIARSLASGRAGRADERWHRPAMRCRRPRNNTPVSPSRMSSRWPSDVGGHEQSPLSHRFEGLQRRDEFGQAHGAPGIGDTRRQCCNSDGYRCGVRGLQTRPDHRGPAIAPGLFRVFSCGPPPTRSTRASGMRAMISGSAASRRSSPS